LKQKPNEPGHNTILMCLCKCNAACSRSGPKRNPRKQSDFDQCGVGKLDFVLILMSEGVRGIFTHQRDFMKPWLARPERVG